VTGPEVGAVDVQYTGPEGTGSYELGMDGDVHRITAGSAHGRPLSTVTVGHVICLSKKECVW
jgi:hypothetical protein